ncbi:MAG: acylneuraminate cytidylyltransferase family protein [Parcubacteria group bacterium]|nr:acylneuraminate cytidylyltransferase family protein [Parcubacteria group bacterium]
MAKSLKILAVIPARGGSKGIPRKNIKLLGGKPLIAWSIEAALASLFVDRVAVSTDDKEIAEVARKYGAEVIMRPAELSEDATPMDPVLAHAVLSLEKESYTPDAVLLLQPTSPLRTTEHIDEGVGTFLNGDFDSLVSVEIIRNGQHKIVEGNRLVPVFSKVQNRDKREPLVIENGALYISKTSLIKEGRIRGDAIGFYEMDRYASLDIDVPIDFIVAERLFKKIV